MLQELVAQVNDKAVGFFNSEEYEDAYHLFGEVLKVEPENHIALHFTAMLLHKAARYDESIKIFDDLIQRFPDDFHLHNNLGMVYLDACCTDDAIKCFELAIIANPKSDVPKVNLGLAYEIKQDYATAIKYFKEVKQTSIVLTSIGHAYSCLNDIDNAIKYCGDAIAVDDLPKAHFNLGILYGLLGEWKKCFAEMEWKWKYFTHISPITGRPKWNGESLNGKRILIYSEQASGDLIQFCRYAAKLKELGAHTILECSGNLIDLLKTCDGVDEVRDKKNRQYDFDYHVSALSLPHYFGIDTKQNYLSAPPSVLDWNKYKNNFKIGLTWAGSPAHQNDHNRSLNCLYFKEICKIPNVKVFSLQKDLYSRFWPRRGMAELSAGVADLSIVNVQDHMKDFYTTAGVIQEMDLIISCDSAVAHVAGALGKPTWLLLPFHPDWRWSLGKDRTIWYDSFKLFRQRSIGVWDDVVNELSQNLIDLLKHSV